MEDTPLSLIKRLTSKGQSEDWSRLSAMYRPLLVNWIRPLVPQDSDVEDVVQETLLVVIAKVGEFRHAGIPGSFRSWLRAIMAIKVRAFWRAQGRVPVATDPMGQMLRELEQDDSQAARRWDTEHDRHVIDSLLERIRPEFAPMTWRAFELYTMRGMSPTEVAACLGITTNAVFIARSRILNRLRVESRGLVRLDAELA